MGDVPYNFLIGGDGNVYEGRGFAYQAEILRDSYFGDYHQSIIVAFIGNFSSEQPSFEHVLSFNNFLTTSVSGNKIIPNYELFSQNQLIDLCSDELEKVLITNPKFIPSKLRLVEV